MTESKESAQSTSEEPRQPFVPQEDRPEVRLNLDTPLSELRIRDLRMLIDPSLHVSKILNSVAERNIAQIKLLLKWEKLEIFELPPIDREWPPRFHPDPRLDQIIQAVSGLTNQVNQLGNQLEELQKKTRR
ncbi:MAG: hypothetical protein V7641_3421 [Blastocatellia bacterium]